MGSGISQKDPDELLDDATKSFLEGMEWYLGIGSGDRRQPVAADRNAYLWFRDSFKKSRSALDMLCHRTTIDIKTITNVADLYCSAVLMAYKSLLRYESTPLLTRIRLYKLRRALKAESWVMWTDDHGSIHTWNRLVQISTPWSRAKRLEKSETDDMFNDAILGPMTYFAYRGSTWT